MLQYPHITEYELMADYLDALCKYKDEQTKAGTLSEEKESELTRRIIKAQASLASGNFV